MYIQLSIQETCTSSGMGGSEVKSACMRVDDQLMFSMRDRKRRVKYSVEEMVEKLMPREIYGE